jgi:adenosylmethionine-8-amino-7-oxononanoate aminotransferase
MTQSRNDTGRRGHESDGATRRPALASLWYCNVGYGRTELAEHVGAGQVGAFFCEPVIGAGGVPVPRTRHSDSAQCSPSANVE